MKQLLTAGLQDLQLPTVGVDALLQYADALLETNKVMNLTAITDPADVATLHFLDSAALLTLADFAGKRVVDVGTGAGFPGMPLRILEPSIRLTLLDSLGKRIHFLQGVCDQLKFADVDCVHARAEEFAAQHRETFDIATSRAVASLPLLAELSLPLVKVGGWFGAYKSQSAEGEIFESRKAFHLLGGKPEGQTDFPLEEPSLDHSVFWIRKVSPTAAKYPRKAGTPEKNPLI